MHVNLLWEPSAEFADLLARRDVAQRAALERLLAGAAVALEPGKALADLIVADPLEGHFVEFVASDDHRLPPSGDAHFDPSRAIVTRLPLTVPASIVERARAPEAGSALRATRALHVAATPETGDRFSRVPWMPADLDCPEFIVTGASGVWPGTDWGVGRCAPMYAKCGTMRATLENASYAYCCPAHGGISLTFTADLMHVQPIGDTRS